MREVKGEAMSRYLELLEKHFVAKEKDAGKFKDFKIGPMRNKARHFEVEGFGHVSIMESTALFGLMKMEAFNMVPTQVDLPLFSIDTITVMGNKTAIVELYEIFLRKENFQEDALLRIKEECSSLPDYKTEDRWYTPLKMESSWAKKVKKPDWSKVDKAISDMLEAFLSLGEKTPRLVNGEVIIKSELESTFASRLVEEGGVSTDMFVKKIGEKETLNFFHSVFYGV
ncbi:MAG: hypothetical protein KBS81_06140 [Spirochaetales bacterium]|nr:hypothetical protein [Candidatus Physcosoma equi]